MPNPFVPVALPSWPQFREALQKSLRGAGTAYQTPPPPPPQTPEGKDIPEPVDPQTEGRQRYFAYRGTETHGVESPDPTLFEDAEGYGAGTIDVVYDETPKGGTVLDVRVIADDAEQLQSWLANQFVAPPAGNPPQMIVSRQRNRTALKVKNMSPTDSVWLGPDANVSAFASYRLDPGEDLTLSSTEAVFALANGPNLVPVCVLSEFTQPA
jgi:hypothetical protein